MDGRKPTMDTPGKTSLKVNSKWKIDRSVKPMAPGLLPETNASASTYPLELTSKVVTEGGLRTKNQDRDHANEDRDGARFKMSPHQASEGVDSQTSLHYGIQEGVRDPFSSRMTEKNPCVSDSQSVSGWSSDECSSLWDSDEESPARQYCLAATTSCTAAFSRSPNIFQIPQLKPTGNGSLTQHVSWDAAGNTTAFSTSSTTVAQGRNQPRSHTSMVQEASKNFRNAAVGGAMARASPRKSDIWNLITPRVPKIAGEEYEGYGEKRISLTDVYCAASSDTDSTVTGHGVYSTYSRSSSDEMLRETAESDIVNSSGMEKAVQQHSKQEKVQASHQKLAQQIQIPPRQNQQSGVASRSRTSFDSAREKELENHDKGIQTARFSHEKVIRKSISTSCVGNRQWHAKDGLSQAYKNFQMSAGGLSKSLSMSHHVFCRPELRQRKILTKDAQKLNASTMYRYRGSNCGGIQVPALRIENAPMKLTNWTSSWQEMFCYNPRPYNVTPEFLDNYVVIRGIFENFIARMTDIVMVDPHTSHDAEPYLHHSYLIPPVCPHEWTISACLQCYTSDDVWLSKGAWERVPRIDPRTNQKMDGMNPGNPPVEPRMPHVPLADYKPPTKKPLIGATTTAVTIKRNQAPASGVSLSPGGRREHPLPVHLWVILGGKDMQALDGIVLAWKFLRWASEIPPEEFVRMSETCDGTQCLFQYKNRIGDLYWHDHPPQEVYKSYHAVGRHPGQDQCSHSTHFSCVGGGDEGVNFNPYGPMIFDMSGVCENEKQKLSFLLVDYPGYGNSSGHPSPHTFRTAALQSVKKAVRQLIEVHDTHDIVINIVGYSLGCAVALNLAADLAESFARDEEADLAFPVKKGILVSSTDELLEKVRHERINPLAKSEDCKRHNYHFDERLLTFKDCCIVDSLAPQKSAHLRQHFDHFRHQQFATPRCRLRVNRLALLAPFTSTQDMAKRITKGTVGVMLSNAISGFVSNAIAWDNKNAMSRLMHAIKRHRDIVNGGTVGRTEASALPFDHLRLYIHHGEKDRVIPWTMGMDVFQEARKLNDSLGLSLWLKFERLPNENHATLLSGKSEAILLETLFCPYRLHPAGPLALLKFYCRITGTPTYLPSGNVRSTKSLSTLQSTASISSSQSEARNIGSSMSFQGVCDQLGRQQSLNATTRMAISRTTAPLCIQRSQSTNISAVSQRHVSSSSSVIHQTVREKGGAISPQPASSSAQAQKLGTIGGPSLGSSFAPSGATIASQSFSAVNHAPLRSLSTAVTSCGSLSGGGSTTASSDEGVSYLYRKSITADFHAKSQIHSNGCSQAGSLHLKGKT